MLWSPFLILAVFIERTTFSTGLPSYNLDIFYCRTDAILSVEAPSGHVVFDYSAGKDCSLQIQAPRGNLGSRFLFNFESLLVGSRNSEGCGNEELRIYDGPMSSGGSYLSVPGCLSDDVYGDSSCNCPDGSDEADTGVCGNIQTVLPRETSSGWTQYLQVLNSPTLSPDEFNGDITLPAVLDDTQDAKKGAELDQHRNETSGLKKGEEATGESPPAPEEKSVGHIAAEVGGCLAAGTAVVVAGVLAYLKLKAKSQNRVGPSV
ncbi:PREDICTED: uncharacterized protein LOC109466580 [Branchiostoma belcheri]|uniref:Uncharacterized protein LOC109466580 n=1 Tax=Branchiostoma belcheri TaxID=7741 RepID=A0A6P4XT94_BRABE|nr:PREDICTED: uncharacterized protein LOC109466580 [Branchiostoma belcheri]